MPYKKPQQKPWWDHYPRVEEDPNDGTKQVLVTKVYGERVEHPIIPLTREQVLANINPQNVVSRR